MVVCFNRVLELRRSKNESCAKWSNECHQQPTKGWAFKIFIILLFTITFYFFTNFYTFLPIFLDFKLN